MNLIFISCGQLWLKYYMLNIARALQKATKTNVTHANINGILYSLAAPLKSTLWKML